MAVRHTVLSQSIEFKEARLSAYHDATFVYDLLTLATVRWGQVTLLQEVRLTIFKFWVIAIKHFSLWNVQ